MLNIENELYVEKNASAIAVIISGEIFFYKKSFYISLIS